MRSRSPAQANDVVTTRRIRPRVGRRIMPRMEPVTPSDARDGSLVPLGRAQAPIAGAFHLEPFRNARRRVACARDFQNRSGCSKTANQRVSSPFASAPRKTVVSKWYPQLSQVHKCRTHRSFTCSDQSGAINISPHCAQGLKYLGWAGRALVPLSRDISKPPKIAAPIRGGT